MWNLCMNGWGWAEEIDKEKIISVSWLAIVSNQWVFKDLNLKKI